MKNLLKLLLKSSLFGLAAAQAFAELSFDNIYSDNMVLQRGEKVYISGSASPNANVCVEFSGQRKSARADENGRWSVLLSPMKASLKPEELKLTSGGESAKLGNVLVGDVWLCSGQSNIDMPVGGHPLLREKLKGESNENVRICLVRRTNKSAENAPRDRADLQINWSPVDAKNLQSFSPLAYYFAKKFSADEGVPVGLVEAAVGGTRIQPWMPEISREIMSDFDDKTSGGHPSHHLYNTMINPLKNMTFKGVLWWQGESSSLYPERYALLFPRMIEDWRKEFKKPELPFIFVVLAAHRAVDGDVTGEAWAWLRDAQLKALKLKNTYAVSAVDIGEYEDIHPQNKELVADRVNSIAKKIGTPDEVKTESPIYESAKPLKDGTLLIAFKNTGSKLLAKRVALNNKKNMEFGKDPKAFVLPENELAGFEICGEDGVFHSAKAKIIDSKRVALKSDRVKSPVAARYMWKSFALGNLYNDKGFPALPFRSDDFKAPDFLGRSVGSDFDAKNLSALGESFEPMLKTAESEFEKVKRGEMEFLKAIKSPKFSGRYAYFKAPEAFKRIADKRELEVEVVYLDSGPDTITLVYDSSDPEVRKGQPNEGAWKTLGALKLEDSGKVKVATFKVSDAKFAGRLNGADIRLQSMPNADFEVLGLFIREGK